MLGVSCQLSTSGPSKSLWQFVPLWVQSLFWRWLWPLMPTEQWPPTLMYPIVFAEDNLFSIIFSVIRSSNIRKRTMQNFSFSTAWFKNSLFKGKVICLSLYCIIGVTDLKLRCKLHVVSLNSRMITELCGVGSSKIIPTPEQCVSNKVHCGEFQAVVHLHQVVLWYGVLWL